MTYAKQLQNPLWQKKRLEILSGSGWRCTRCPSTTRTLHVHHINYDNGKKPWNYPNENFIVLCDDCHSWIEAQIRIFRWKIANDLRQSPPPIPKPPQVEERYADQRPVSIAEMRAHFNALRAKLGMK